MFIILAFVTLGCGNGKPANGNDNANSKASPAPRLNELLDTGDLWLSARKMAEAMVEKPVGFTIEPGGLGFFRFAYSADIKGAIDAMNTTKELTKQRKWYTPDELIYDPLAAMYSFDDIIASYGMKLTDPVADWPAIDEAYGGISRDDLPAINEKFATKDGITQYAIDASGFFSAVDHQASLCGYVAANGLSETAGFEPSTILLARYSKWWVKKPEDGVPGTDFMELLGMYDVATYPAALDIAYRQTGDVLLYYAMADILGTYRDLIDYESLGTAIGTVPLKNRAVAQLCMLARLFRRMYAFTDDDGYLETAEGILTQIGPVCLKESTREWMMYTHSLLFATEPALHVVVVGPSDDPIWSQFAQLARDRYEPRLALMPLDNDRDADLIDEIGYYGTAAPSAIVCVDINCFSPIKDPAELEGLFQRGYEEIGKARTTRLEKLKDGE